MTVKQIQQHQISAPEGEITGSDFLDLVNNDAVRLNKIAGLLKVLSNEKRIKILGYLSIGEQCVSDLENIVGLSQSALSQHLAKLRAAEMVATRREAQSIYYSIKEPSIQDLINYLIKMDI